MSVRFWCRLIIAGAMLATLGTQAMAQQKGSAADKLREKVLSCFIPPPGATDTAVIIATLEQDGSVRNTPKIIRKGEGPINNTFAKAGVRAILKCAPYTGLGIQGEVTFNFDSSGLPFMTHEAAAGGREVMTTPDGDQLAFNPPEGLCKVDPSKGGVDKKLWSGNPVEKQGGGKMFSLWTDCGSLDTARKGDFSTPPRHSLSFVEINHSPTIPDKLDEFISFLVNRDKNRYIPAKRFLDDPKLVGATFLDHDDRAVYYGLRMAGSNGTAEDAGISSYTLISNHPLVIFYYKFRSNLDDALRNEAKSIVESLHTLNR